MSDNERQCLPYSPIFARAFRRNPSNPARRTADPRVNSSQSSSEITRSSSNPGQVRRSKNPGSVVVAARKG